MLLTTKRKKKRKKKRRDGHAAAASRKQKTATGKNTRIKKKTVIKAINIITRYRSKRKNSHLNDFSQNFNKFCIVIHCHGLRSVKQPIASCVVILRYFFYAFIIIISFRFISFFFLVASRSRVRPVSVR